MQAFLGDVWFIFGLGIVEAPAALLHIQGFLDGFDYLSLLENACLFGFYTVGHGHTSTI